MLVVATGVGLGVLFALLGIVQVLSPQIGLGLAVVCLTVSALIYVFYSRGGAVEKTGYGSLLFIVAIAFIIPLLIVNQQEQQATAASAKYDLTLQRGAALYGQYCASCHGFQGQGLAGPKLNNNPAVNSLTNDDLTRIISGGIPGDPTDPSKLAMPAWLNTFGGPLTEEDISYLVTLIRSSDPAYLKTQNLPTVNGFDYVLGTLTNETQIAQYKEQKNAGNKPPASSFYDATSQKSVNIDAINTPGGVANWGWQVVGQTTANVTVKVGTTINFGNQSSNVHNVYQGANGVASDKFPKSPLIPENSTAAYAVTLTTPGDYPYFCGLHPAMVGYIQVVP
jgi:plastocyanin/mono/diheme cytochrome c family protein